MCVFFFSSLAGRLVFCSHSRAPAEVLLLLRHDSVSMLTLAYTSSSIFLLSVMSISFVQGKPGNLFKLLLHAVFQLSNIPPPILQMHNLNLLRVWKRRRHCFHASLRTLGPLPLECSSLTSVFRGHIACSVVHLSSSFITAALSSYHISISPISIQGHVL